MLVYRDRALCSQGSLHNEMQLSMVIFIWHNGYTDQQIHKVLNLPVRDAPSLIDPDYIAFLPKLVSLQPRKISRFL
jgi:hypothetical protein